jgi:hypothetical protein
MRRLGHICRHRPYEHVAKWFVHEGRTPASARHTYMTRSAVLLHAVIFRIFRPSLWLSADGVGSLEMPVPSPA